MNGHTISQILLRLVSIGGMSVALVTSTSTFANGSILVLNLLDSQAKHYHAGKTVFGNNEREGIANWKIEQEVDRYIRESSPFSTVVSLDSPPALLEISRSGTS